jgi:predicted O-methyltransferase YrrM
MDIAWLSEQARHISDRSRGFHIMTTSPITAETIFARFKSLPGSDQMASQHAIGGLMSAIRRYRPATVLEIGSGIGTLTFALVQAFAALGIDDCRITTVEDNEFCLRQLRRNLDGHLHRVNLVHDIGELTGRRFDLIVVDGGNQRDERFMSLLAQRGVLFVEGFRSPQRLLIGRSPRRVAAANVRSMKWDPSLEPSGGWGGAYWIFRFEPSPWERLWFTARHVWDGVLVTKRRALQSLYRPHRRSPARSNKTSDQACSNS